MGILKLNKLFERCPTEQLGKPYDVVIIDGSNMVFQTLCSGFSQMKKSGLLLSQWDSINTDLLSQIAFIIKYSIDRIKDNIIKRFDSGISEVVVVIDPTETPQYIINSSFTYNHKYQDLLDPDLKNNVDVSFTIKSEEQEKRRMIADKSNKKQLYCHEIETFDELETNQRKDLLNIFNQSFAFNENRELLKLANYIIKEIYRQLNSYNFKIINAIDEADFVIKNVAASYPTDKLILMLSMDTDYNILFGDMPNVDTCSLMSRYMIYNPYKCWSMLFNGSACFDYEHILRLAPLFGNDYTIKEFLVSAEKFEDILNLYEGKISILKRGSVVKKITKFTKTIREEINEPISLEKLDDWLRNWNEKYFIKYFMSNIIYTNWRQYNRYTVMTKPNEVDCTTELETFWKTFITFPFTLYKWDSTDLFNNWDNFFSKLEKIDFECADELIDYYYKHEYHDDAEYFVE